MFGAGIAPLGGDNVVQFLLEIFNRGATARRRWPGRVAAAAQAEAVLAQEGIHGASMQVTEWPLRALGVVAPLRAQ